MLSQREKTDILEQYDRDAAQLIITLETALGCAHWLTTMQNNSIKHIRQLLVKELSQ